MYYSSDCRVASVSAVQLDGLIARQWASQRSVLGSAIDPLADKWMMTIMIGSLAGAGLIPRAQQLQWCQYALV